MKKTQQKIPATTFSLSFYTALYKRKNQSYYKSQFYVWLIVIGFTFLFNSTNAQDHWKWAKNIGNSMSRSISSDNYGNIFSVGEYSNDSILFDTICLRSNGGGDAFIAKYNSNGHVLWAKGIGGSDLDRARSVCTDSYGNIYVAGEYWSDSILIDTFTLLNTDYGFDIFIAKYDKNGNVLWAKSAGGNYIDYVNGIAATDQGDVYITGSFWGTYIEFDTIVLTNSGNIDMYIAKYDPAGNTVWAHHGIGNDQDEAYDISVDHTGKVYIAGSFRSDHISFGNITLINSSENLCFGDLCFDAYIVKYNENGIVEWAVNPTGKNWDEACGIVVDTLGNIYTTGIYMSDPIYFESLALANCSSFDVYVSKYDSNGHALWATGIGGNSSDYVEDIALDVDGNIYICGGFSSDSLEIGSHLFVNKGINDFFMAKYDHNGNIIGAKSSGGNNWDICLGVSVDPLSDVYLTGYFESDVISMDAIDLTKTGSRDMFIAKIEKQHTYFEENEKNESLKIYPNPFYDLAHFEFDNQKAEKHSLEVYTASGKLVRSINEITTGHILIERKNLTSGLYFFRLWNNQQMVASGKFIVR